MEEVELVRAAKEGNQEAMTALVELHKGLLKYHAGREWDTSPLSYEDVMSLGYVTLMECIYSFKEEGGLPFGRWVGNNLHYVIRDERLKARYPHFKANLKVLRAVAAIKGGYDKDVNQEHMEQAKEYIAQDVVVGNMPLPNQSDDDMTFYDLATANDEEPFRDSRPVLEAIAKLPKKCRNVMELVIKLDGTGEKGEANKALIAEELGISRERVRQLYNQSIDLMRGHLHEG